MLIAIAFRSVHLVGIVMMTVAMPKTRRGNSAPRIAPMLIAIAGHVTDCIVSVETASAFTVANATGTAPSTNVPSNVLPASTSARR